MEAKPSKPRDYWSMYSSLFRGSDIEDFRDGKARDQMLRTNASVFAITYRDDIDTLRKTIVADACDICESVTVLNQFVFTERQRLKAIIYILNALCERYKVDLETSLKPGYAFVERLNRIEKAVTDNQEMVKKCSEKQQEQLQMIIDHINGISDDPEDLTVAKSDNQD